MRGIQASKSVAGCLAAVSALTLLSGLALLSGCSHDAPPQMASGPPGPPNGAGRSGSRVNNAVPDDKVYPAPNGVKTGLEANGSRVNGR